MAVSEMQQCITALGAAHERLVALGQQFQAAKAVAQGGPADGRVFVCVDGVPTTDLGVAPTEVLQASATAAANGIATQIVQIWEELRSVVQRANDICAASKVAAEGQQGTDAPA